MPPRYRAIRPSGEVPNVEEGQKKLRDVADKFYIRAPISRIEDLEIAGADGPLKARLFSESSGSARPAMV